MQPIAIYARVSTDEQHPEAQLAELRAYAKRRRVQTIEYVDRGVSGRKQRRRALDQMLQAARRQEVRSDDSSRWYRSLATTYALECIRPHVSERVGSARKIRGKTTMLV